MELHNNFHCIDKGAAKQCGVNGALLLWNFRYWIDENIANNRNFHDGRYWTYQSMDALCKTFDYLTVNQIRTAIDKLEKGGYIVKGNYNKSSYDRTTWYSITEAGYAVFSDFRATNAPAEEPNSICEETQMEAGNSTNGNGEEPNSIRGKNNIPDYKPTDNYADKYPPNPPTGGMGEKSANASVGGASKPKQETAKTTELLSADEEQSLIAFSPSLCDIVREWLQYKAGKKQTYTPVGKKKLLNKIRQNAAQCGADAMIEAIDAAMANNWQGIVWDRISQPPRGNGYHGGGYYGNRQEPYSRHVDESGNYRYNPGDTTGSF